MFNTKRQFRSKPGSGVSHLPERTVARSVWSKEVDSFLDVFVAVMRQTRAPRCAQDKYLAYMRIQLLNRRSGFLAQCRNYPIFGLRLLGDDVNDVRTTDKMFKSVRMKYNSDGIRLPIFLGWYWNHLWSLRKSGVQSESQATEISRILAVLSFSKFLKIDCKKSRKRAQVEYSARVRDQIGKIPGNLTVQFNDPLYLDMKSYLKSYGYDSYGTPFCFDRRCYSLKSLVGKKPHRPPVPPAYGLQSININFSPIDDDGRQKPNLLSNVVNRYYYSKEEFDAKLCIINETGGKYRGICPYQSPYAHCTNLYREARKVLHRLRGNCNYDQAAGHDVARSLSLNYKPKVSADASNFTDTISGKHLVLMARALNADDVIRYHSKLRIKDFNGEIFDGCTPLMGWKGTFDLSSVILAHSVERVLGPAKSRERVQCGDDLLGFGKLEDYIESYEAIGCKLSEEKTIVSKSVTVFCGESYCNGYCITPQRFVTYGLSFTNRFVGEMIARIRSFVERCNYSTNTRWRIYSYLKKHLGERYRGYLDFRLTSNLGGIPLDMGQPEALVSYLEGSSKRLTCALCNIPYEVEDFIGHTNDFAHLPLGKPYNRIFGLNLPLTPGSWPTKKRLSYARRKADIKERLSNDRVGVGEVLLYLYDGTMLKA